MTRSLVGAESPESRVSPVSTPASIGAGEGPQEARKALRIQKTIEIFEVIDLCSYRALRGPLSKKEPRIQSRHPTDKYDHYVDKDYNEYEDEEYEDEEYEEDEEEEYRNELDL